MSDAEPISRTRFQQMVNSPTLSEEPASDDSGSSGSAYLWRGQRYRVVPERQAPLLQLRTVLSPRLSLQVKYAYITHQSLNQQNENNQNELTIIVRDSMRVTIEGYNLAELDDALLLQRVLEIQHVSELQSAAAIQRGESSSILTDIRLEYGRFDIENCIWMPGNGYWCDRQREWISDVAPPSEDL